MQANRQFFPGSLVLAVTARIVAIWKGLRTKATTAFSLNVPDLSREISRSVVVRLM